MTEPIVLQPDQGKTFIAANTRITIKVSSSENNQQFSVTEYEVPAEFPGPPLHVHRIYEHMWYVLEGEISVTLSTETFEALPGTCIYVPKGTAHTFANPGSRVARMLAIDTPGGFENYYVELAAALPGDVPPDPAVIAEIQQRYDTHPLKS